MFNKIKKEISSILRMFSLVFKTGKKESFFVGLVCLITSLMHPLLLEFNYRILNQVENRMTDSMIQIVWMVLVTVVVSSIFQVTNFSNLLLFEKMQVNIGTKLMNKIFKTVKCIPHSFFDNPDNTAKLKRIVMFSQDSMLTQNVVHMISMFCNFLSLILIFPVVHRAGIEVFIMILLISVLSNLFNFDEGYLRWEHQDRQEKGNIVKEKFKSYFFDKDMILEMRMLNSYDHIQKKWQAIDAEMYEKDYAFEKNIEKRKLFFETCCLVLKMFPILYVSWKFSIGRLDIAIVFLIWQMQGQFNGIMESVFNEFKAVHYSVPYIDELCEFLLSNHQVKEHVENDKEPLIELKDVSFAYVGTDHILKNIDLSIHQGEKIAIIGPNGAGKTTLVKVLANLYQPSKGEIKYRIKKTDMGVVWQDYVKFELTLKESIGLGNVKKINDNDELQQLIDDLKLELGDIGLEDIIGRSFDSDGKIPSGGQWQKIAIARSMYGNKLLLYMDEPTASLDPVSEVQLYSNIKQLFSDKTVLFVSHRVGFANLADRIIVVNDGSIVEDGSHNELMKNKGFYYKFYTEQLKWYRKEQ